MLLFLDLFETHKLSCLLGGLQTEIQMVRMFQPTSVMKAFSLVKNANSMHAKPFSKNFKFNPVAKSPLLTTPSTSLEPIKPKTQTIKQLTPTYTS